MEDNNDLIKILFMELVEELGGIVKLDANVVINKVKVNKLKSIGVRVENEEIIVEVFDEDENQEVNKNGSSA